MQNQGQASPKGQPTACPSAATGRSEPPSDLDYPALEAGQLCHLGAPVHLVQGRLGQWGRAWGVSLEEGHPVPGGGTA